MTPITQLTVTARHEAGHAVAAVARSCGRVGIIHAITVGEGRGAVHHRRVPGEDWAIALAGPWAEARFLWEHWSPGDDWDDESDMSGVLFEVFSQQPSDYEAYTGDLHRWTDKLTGDGMDASAATAAVQEMDLDWTDALEALWPAIQHIAALLIKGVTVTEGVVRAAVGQAYSSSDPQPVTAAA
ncbi:hypothetical protein [Georgenia yuyongxinii]|uniref:Peptidase M41 domain-containing protein n=1 Tax=Georgenia yuyongxinii TaxID=2589797 RepID=A0A552WUG3_9MICO|nr:hypothetical protein [Georgenia yuyongxinii]TRW46414.1 hypothetical protein FJ693_05665 [Georgenia yuyongxinii]